MNRKSNNSRPDIDFVKELWDAANELRGAVAENQYKDFVLSLIFLKHLSERYELRKQELSDLVHNPNSDYHTTDGEEIGSVLGDQDEYTAKNVFKFTDLAT